MDASGPQETYIPLISQTAPKTLRMLIVKSPNVIETNCTCETVGSLPDGAVDSAVPEPLCAGAGAASPPQAARLSERISTIIDTSNFFIIKPPFTVGLFKGCALRSIYQN